MKRIKYKYILRSIHPVGPWRAACYKESILVSLMPSTQTSWPAEPHHAINTCAATLLRSVTLLCVAFCPTGQRRKLDGAEGGSLVGCSDDLTHRRSAASLLARDLQDEVMGAPGAQVSKTQREG